MDQQEAQALLHKADEHIGRNELPEAQKLLEQAVRLDPMSANAHQDLGVTYARQGHLREGIACFRRALEIAPDSPGIYSNLGLAYHQAGILEEAVWHLRKAVLLGASSPDTYKNLALALTALPDPASAEECYWAALRLKPDDAEAHYNLARVQLMQGKFQQGWLEYEWRRRWRKTPSRHLDSPCWSGQKLDGKRLIILAENDTRDTVQLIRYADVIARQGGRVAVECQPALARLLTGALGLDHVIPAGEPLPQHDYHVALLSLPATLGTTLQTIPADRPYLGVNSQATQQWQKRLAKLPGIKIGIAWQADSAGEKTQWLIPPGGLQHLAEVSGVTLVNLQAGPLPQGSVPLGNLAELPGKPGRSLGRTGGRDSWGGCADCRG